MFHTHFGIARVWVTFVRLVHSEALLICAIQGLSILRHHNSLGSSLLHAYERY